INHPASHPELKSEALYHQANELAYRLKLALAENRPKSGEPVNRLSGDSGNRLLGDSAKPNHRITGIPNHPVTESPNNPPSAEADLIQVEHDLGLLHRGADLHSTELEARSFAPRLNQFVALTKALLTACQTVNRLSGDSGNRLL